MRWFERHLPAAGVSVRPCAMEYTGLSIAGPQSRALLQSLVRDDLSTAAFPFMSFRRMEIGMVPGYVGRVSFTGRAGFRDLGDLGLPAGALRSLDEGGPRAWPEAVRRASAQCHAHREELRHLGARISPDLRPLRGGSRTIRRFQERPASSAVRRRPRRSEQRRAPCGCSRFKVQAGRCGRHRR